MPINPRWIAAYVLLMPALKVGNPIETFIQVVIHDLARCACLRWGRVHVQGTPYAFPPILGVQNCTPIKHIFEQPELHDDSTVVTMPFPAGRRSLSKKLSILLDTHSHKEQDHVAVSLFEAKLPLLSPFAVSLKDKHRIEREEAQPTRLFLDPSRAHPPVRRTGPHALDASGSKSYHSSPTRFDAGRNIGFLEKENYHVRTKQNYRPSSVR